MKKLSHFKLIDLVNGETIASGSLPEIEEKTNIPFDDLYSSMKNGRKIREGRCIVIKVYEGDI